MILSAYLQTPKIKIEACMGGLAESWLQKLVARVDRLNFRSEESCSVAWVHRYQVRSSLQLCSWYLGYQPNVDQ